MNQPITAIKHGNLHCCDTLDASTPGCRLPAQHTAIIAWHKEHPSAWWMTNPFEGDTHGKVYNCTFWHHYFDDAGNIQSVKVTPTGRITFLSDKVLTGQFKRETDAVIQRYGAFRG